MKFSDAINNQITETTNGMKAFTSSSNACCNLFYKIGASRGKDIYPDFIPALLENEDYAIRILLWTRDIRSGAGERKLFRDVLQYLESSRPDIAEKLIPKIPELGRFDDLFHFNSNLKEKAFLFYREALLNNNALAYKWAYREKSLTKYNKEFQTDGANINLPFAAKLAKLNPQQRHKYLTAIEFRKFLGFSQKQYRKMLSNGTNVVESKMCNKQWDQIEFSKIPSLAHSRYKKAFLKNAKVQYEQYAKNVVSGEEKINAGAVYPYDVVKTVLGYTTKSLIQKTERDVITEQWKALPNYVGDSNILPMIDVSGSMYIHTNAKKLRPIDISISLGLYLTEKNIGDFKDIYLTFHTNPELKKAEGDIIDKILSCRDAVWGGSTNLNKAFDKVLNLAIQNNIPESEMPKYIIVLSDMQFDQSGSESAFEMIASKYEQSGYTLPKIIFWNLNDHDNIPVKYNDNGVAMISGFSPSIMKSILNANLDEFTPEKIMLNTILNPKYSW